MRASQPHFLNRASMNSALALSCGEPTWFGPDDSCRSHSRISGALNRASNRRSRSRSCAAPLDVKPSMSDPAGVTSDAGMAAPARQVKDRQVNPTPNLRMTAAGITAPLSSDTGLRTVSMIASASLLREHEFWSRRCGLSRPYDAVPIASAGRAVAKWAEIAARGAGRLWFDSASRRPARLAAPSVPVMLHLYVLYTCVHLNAAKHASGPGTTRCVERQVFFHADECRKALPKPGALTEKTRESRSWLECKATAADSWIAADASGPENRLYEAHAGVADADALSALLAPLSAQARATLEAAGFKHAFGKAFQGPGRLSFFVVGSGSSVTVFA